MKKANLLFDILWLVGLGLAFLSFFTFVPESSRTRVAWLDFGIGLLIYTGFAGRLMVLFRPLAKFSDAVPFIATYWIWWGTYVAVAVIGMVVFQCLNVSFEKQALLQGIFFFVFFCVVAFGIWGTAWMTRSSQRDRRTIGGVREIQMCATALRVAASDLPMSCEVVKREVERTLDDINCMAGSNDERAFDLERKIGELIDQACQNMSNPVSEEVLAKTLKELRKAIAVRKTI